MRKIYSVSFCAAGIKILLLFSLLTFQTPNQVSGEDVSKVLTRDQIEQKYKWSLEDIYATNEAWESDFKVLESRTPEIEKFAGTLGSGPERLVELFTLKNSLGLILGKLYVYSHMKRDEDTGADTYQAMADRIEALAAKYSAAGSFVVPEILKIDEAKLLGWLDSDESLGRFRHAIEDIVRTRQYTLSPEEEKLLAMSSEMAQSPRTVFGMLDNADIQYPEIETPEGEMFQLSKARYSKIMENEDREYRKRAFEAFYKVYNGYENTLAALLSSVVKRDIFYARARGYETSLQAALDSDNIPTEVYDNVVATINDNLEPMHRYVALRKKMLGLDKVHAYDLYVPMFPRDEDNYEYDDAVKLVKESLTPLGKEYNKIMIDGFSGGWIDVYETKGKRSGGYSWGSYSTHPYILLNYNGTLNEVFTVAHEMGHAMHSYLTWNNQPYVYGDYTIFLAEVASTTNEALLMDHMLGITDEKKQELALLDHYLHQIQGTVYIQALFAEFEREIHSYVESGQALTSSWLNELMGSLYQKYYGPDFVLDEQYRINWGRIPHFYNNFYVYQYATGFSAAALLAEKITSEGQPAVDRYLEFLKSGSSDYSINLLTGAGVDMTSPDPVQAVARKMSELLDRIDEILAEQ